MTEEDLDRLAALIAKALVDGQHRESPKSRPSRGAERTVWLPIPVRPEGPERGKTGDAPVWSGAAQSLADQTTGGSSSSPGHRVPISELTNATRAAAAGRGAPSRRETTGRALPAGRSRPANAAAIDVTVGVSNRHIHLAPADFRELFGNEGPTVDRAIKQPGQFAAKESVDVVGPKGRIDRVRVVGPARGATQLEVSISDCHRLGIDAPVAASGSLAASAGGVTLIGPAGSVALTRGVIVAARHLHLSEDDARRWGLHDGDRLDVRSGSDRRPVTFHNVLVRMGPTHATELHLDLDEALAAELKTGDRATILAWRASAERKRRLITERDVREMASRNETLPTDAILTPAARDRARALKLLAP
ncbi:MAG: phosphate propanoyltransferase [Gemmatimonadaceae bacterium]